MHRCASAYRTNREVTMAKKSGKKKAASREAPPPTGAAEVTADTQSETSLAVQSEPVAPETSALQTENDALRTELEQLKMQLASKDTEISELKNKLDSSMPPQIHAASKSAGEMNALQERLSQLKRDQHEADAARDMAWSELKRCVQEVAKLANAELKDAQHVASTN